jgi:hypothetical protein
VKADIRRVDLNSGCKQGWWVHAEGQDGSQDCDLSWRDLL